MCFLFNWKTLFRGKNSFQVILCIILIYSLTSIIIIYVHLMWFFSEDKIWKRPEISQSRDNSIVWNMHSKLNALSSRIISSDEISITGWWMDHVRWNTDIKCFNQKWALCSKGFSSSCKSDGIRAIYQYVTFSKDLQIKGFELSLTATADQLESQAVGATFGALALVKLSDGQTEFVELQFPSIIEPLTTKSVSFSAGALFVTSVTVMLMCYGYSGNTHFTNPVLLPHASLFEGMSDLIHQCPAKGKKRVVQTGIIKQEEVLKFTNKSIKDNLQQVTLVTQVSMDRLTILERSLNFWNGPVSLVIYVASKHSKYEWQRLYIQKKLKNLQLSTSSHVTLAFGNSVNGDYPINMLRNMAVKQVKTKYMFLLDADFQPSPDFQRKFLNSIKSLDLSYKAVFVVPAFEYMEMPKQSDNAPQTKEELLQLLHREDPFISPFRISESSESHRITDYWKWYRADKLYTLNTFCDKYEPYIVLNSKMNEYPLYDERFSGYGMNKVTHITELFAANYTFVILPDVWVLHLPHKISLYAVEFLQNAHQRLKNRMERFEFLADIMNTYKIGNCK